MVLKISLQRNISCFEAISLQATSASLYVVTREILFKNLIFLDFIRHNISAFELKKLRFCGMMIKQWNIPRILFNWLCDSMKWYIPWREITRKGHFYYPYKISCYLMQHINYNEIKRNNFVHDNISSMLNFITMTRNLTLPKGTIHSNTSNILFRMN